MKIAEQIDQIFPGCFTILILDNEVTLDSFITDPPLKWARLINENRQYLIPKNYPTSMTKAESDREEMNWDRVDLNVLRASLSELDSSVDLVAIGNNASQGLPLAEALPTTMRADNAAIIYGTLIARTTDISGHRISNLLYPRRIVKNRIVGSPKIRP